MPTTNYKNIILDLGGVVMNFDFQRASTMFCSLGLPPLMDAEISTSAASRHLLGLINTYINGFLTEEQLASHLLPHCNENVTLQDVVKILFSLSGDIPLERVRHIVSLRSHYKVILLSNINPFLWQQASDIIRQRGFSTAQCFDHTFLSYEMQVAKPDPAIYHRMIAETGILPPETIYFDDLPDNIEAGKKAGLHSVQVKPNHLEDCRQYISL